jgi:hypothetical protein
VEVPVALDAGWSASHERGLYEDVEVLRRILDRALANRLTTGYWHHWQHPLRLHYDLGVAVNSAGRVMGLDLHTGGEKLSTSKDQGHV